MNPPPDDSKEPDNSEAASSSDSLTSTNVNTGDEVESPQTGDATPIVYATLVIASVAGMLYINRRRVMN